jgi:hypothetical protein
MSYFARGQTLTGFPPLALSLGSALERLTRVVKAL